MTRLIGVATVLRAASDGAPVSPDQFVEALTHAVEHPDEVLAELARQARLLTEAAG